MQWQEKEFHATHVQLIMNIMQLIMQIINDYRNALIAIIRPHIQLKAVQDGMRVDMEHHNPLCLFLFHFR